MEWTFVSVDLYQNGRLGQSFYGDGVESGFFEGWHSFEYLFQILVLTYKRKINRNYSKYMDHELNFCIIPRLFW